MQVSFESSLRPFYVSRETDLTMHLSPAMRGLSDIRSLANASSVGFNGSFAQIYEKIRVCFWTLFNSIKSCLCSNPPTRSTECPPSSLEHPSRFLNRRIELGREIIDHHFSGSIFNSSDNHSIVIVVLKYNHELVPSFGPLLEGRDHRKAAAITALSQLLNSDINRHCENGRLEIDTIVIKRRNDSRYDYVNINTWIRFPDGVRDSRSFIATSIYSLNMITYLERVIPFNEYPSAMQNALEISSILFEN
jgi:hypothetical protein